MKIFIISVLLSLSLITPVKAVEAPYKPPEPPTIVVKSIYEKIADIAEEYDVSPSVMNTVIKCESNYNSKAVGDQGRSFGISQIFLPAHPEVTKEEALDEDFSLRFLAKQLSIGNGHLWTCFRMYY